MSERRRDWGSNGLENEAFYDLEAVDEARQRRVVSAEAKEGHDSRLVLFEYIENRGCLWRLRLPLEAEAVTWSREAKKNASFVFQ